VHQQALRIDEDMPLLAFDLLARVVARRIDRTPPSHGVFPVKLIHFVISLSPGRLDPKREPVFAMQP